MSTPFSCPHCGGPIDLVTDGKTGRLWFNVKTGRAEMRVEPAIFGACSRCDFCIEVNTTGGVR